MRYSRMKEQEDHSRGSGKGAIVVVVLILAAALYTIGASEIGDFLSKNVVTPVVAWVTGKEPEETAGSDEEPSAAPSPGASAEASASAGTESVSDQFSIEANTVYALQVGVFDEEANAEEMAQTLKDKGGAGYIIQDGDSYRVIISAYRTEAEAENVKTRLAEEQKLDSKLYNITTEQINVELSAPEEYLAQLEDAIEESADIHEALLELSLSYDKGDLNLEQVKSELETLKDTADEKVSQMEAIDKSGTVEAVAEIKGFYSGVSNTLGQLMEAETQVNMSSGIKAAYMDVVVTRKEMISSFE